MKIRNLFKINNEFNEDSTLYLKPGVAAEGLAENVPYSVEDLGDNLVMLKEVPGVLFKRADFQLETKYNLPIKISAANLKRLYSYIMFREDGKSIKITPDQVEKITSTHVEGNFNAVGFNNKEYRTKVPLIGCEFKTINKGIVKGDTCLVTKKFIQKFSSKGVISGFDPKQKKEVNVKLKDLVGENEYALGVVSTKRKGEPFVMVKLTENLGFRCPINEVFVNQPRKLRKLLETKDNVLVKSIQQTGTIIEIIPTSSRKYYRIELDSGEELTTERNNLKLIK